MFVMDCYGHKLSNGVLFAHHLILDVPGGSSHLGYRRRVPPGHYPHTRVNLRRCGSKYDSKFWIAFLLWLYLAARCAVVAPLLKWVTMRHASSISMDHTIS